MLYTMNMDRARGALLGLAVGDALGTTYEFERIRQPAYPELAVGPATELVGGGPFGLVAGQVTDDTQMAVCLARSLAERGRLDVDDVARRYVAWTSEAFDIGNQTRGALDRIEAGARPWDGGLGGWRDGGRRAAGNGSLMRTVPIAVALAANGEDAVIDAALADSLITHADPRCALACAAFDAGVAAAIAHGAEAGAMIAAARGALAVAELRLGALWREALGGEPEELRAIGDARVELEGDLELAEAAEPALTSGRPVDLHATAGFVRVAFRLAFWHLGHTSSWQAAVVDVASRGGDADTNAAIVGALLGARDGEASIPGAWIERVLAARQPGSEGWADAHHPRHLLALAARR